MWLKRTDVGCKVVEESQKWVQEDAINMYTSQMRPKIKRSKRLHNVLIATYYSI